MRSSRVLWEVVLCLLGCALTLIAQTPGRQSVLIFLPDPPGRPLSNVILEGLQSELRMQHGDIAISADYVSQRGVNNPQFQAAELNWYRTKYADRKFDIMIAVGYQAYESVGRLRNDLWPGVPLIFCGIDPNTWARLKHQENTTGIILNYRIRETLKVALELLPGAKHIAIVGGSAPSDRLYNSRFPEFMKELGARQDLIDLTNLPLSELRKRISKLPPDTFIVIYSYFFDPAGRPMFIRDLIEALAPVANAPIFDGSDFSMGYGSTGGYQQNFSIVGVEAARLALRVLNGEPASQIPLSYSGGSSYQFDWRELEKWKIPLRRLPPQSKVLFREETAWERFRWWIAGISLFTIVESALIAVLLVERRRAMRGEALNAAILASLPGQIFILDRNGSIIRSSRPRENMPFSTPASGASYEEVWKDVSGVAASDISRVRTAMQSTLNREAGEPVIEVRCAADENAIQKDRWIEIRMEALDRAEGGAVISHLDISGSKRAEIEARQSKEAILHLNRISSMGELTASLAHELNQPLAGILTNAQGALRFLDQPAPDLEEVRAALADIQDDGSRAGEVIRKMRNMLKTGRAQSAPLNLNQVVEDAVALLRPDAHMRKISIALFHDPLAPLIDGDAIQLQQVVTNLVLNAMEAMQDALVLRYISVRVAGSPDGRRAEVTVTDSGPGIAPESLSRIFQPFFTTKAEGLGMGLSISRSIVEAHRASITASNSPGSGATFRLSFPASRILTQ